MKNRMKSGIVLGFVAVLAAVVVSATPAGAFNHPWVNFMSVNVLPGERAFYDDIAGGMAGAYTTPDAGLLLFLNNQTVSEYVAYYTNHGFPVTTALRYVDVRAAVSDYGYFRVGISNSPTGTCVYPSQLLWTPAMAPYGYMIKTFVLPTNYNVRKICVLMGDSPVTVAVGKTNALIDYIRLRTATGAIGWLEGFTGTP